MYSVQNVFCASRHVVKLTRNPGLFRFGRIPSHKGFEAKCRFQLRDGFVLCSRSFWGSNSVLRDMLLSSQGTRGCSVLKEYPPIRDSKQNVDFNSETGLFCAAGKYVFLDLNCFYIDLKRSKVTALSPLFGEVTSAVVFQIFSNEGFSYLTISSANTESPAAHNEFIN
ncbi:hypothetical protein CEXT_282001 [Caerostris extrusa]|uniref:Uncharacterized protein n=1 Tax=Caerostris extrusa TaxID=172846 RepID=A0AAV4MX29_CAEEX|nr:hypothetical protein CEXT_282001 [Caerostris extrusa]